MHIAINVLRDFANFVAANIGTFWIIRSIAYLANYHDLNVIGKISISSIIIGSMLNIRATKAFIKVVGELVIYVASRLIAFWLVHWFIYKLGYPENYANIGAAGMLMLVML
jgi:hypothetical protein